MKSFKNEKQLEKRLKRGICWEDYIKVDGKVFKMVEYGDGQYDNYMIQDKLTEDGKRRALLKLEAMTDTEFNNFLSTTPQRTQMLIRSHLSDWREILPQYLIEQEELQTNQE